jgi:prepilin-type N-terminal cleavage/methylation domain-containing protein
MRSARGFSLVEMLLAVALTLVIAAAMFGAVRSAQQAAVVQPELADLQQRLRIATTAISADVLLAGAPAAGSAPLVLARTIPTVLPFRAGPVEPDPPGMFRPDTLTLIAAAASAVQTTIIKPMTPADTSVRLDAQAGCPLKGGVRDPACGFEAGVMLMIFDATGAHDQFVVAAVAGDVLLLQHRGSAGRSHTYLAGSAIVATTSVTYYRRAATGQLMRYNGVEADVPAVDQVAALRFEYFGVAAGGALVPISAAEFTDGPWRPDAADPNRYDQDLLRIRQVSVSLRVGSATATPAVPDLAPELVPELDVRFELAPRSLNGAP